MLDRQRAPAIGFIELGQLIGDARLFQPQLQLEAVGDLVFAYPLQAGFRQAEHAEMLQRAELVQLLDQGVVIFGSGGGGGGEIHNSGDQRQQGSRVMGCYWLR